MIKISVVIPVYNNERFLCRCLDSVVNQTLKELEIILIDDGSEDNSLQILENYAQNDKRIVLISRANKGVAYTRNEGIKIAKGDYISFIDSDDYIENSFFYEKLYNSVIKNNAEIAKGNYKFEATQKIDSIVNEKINEDKNYFTSQFCSAIFKRSFILQHQIKFPSLTDMEDPVFTFNCAIKAEKINIVENANYVVVSNSNSTTRRILKKQQIIDKIVGFEKILCLANNANDLSQTVYDYVASYWYKRIYYDIFNCASCYDICIAHLELSRKYINLNKNKNAAKLVCKLFFKTILNKLFSIRNIRDGKYKQVIICCIKINIRNVERI